MRKTVLVVEDDVDQRTILCEMLDGLGWRAVSARAGDEALRYLAAGGGCDAVVSDVVMPGMSGLELLRHIRGTHAGLPIALVTGQPEAVEVALAAGAIPLLKPYTVEVLERVLTEAFA